MKNKIFHTQDLCLRKSSGRMEVFMKEVDEKVMRNMIFEVLHVERKNLRSKAKTDQRMAEELAKIIVDYARMSM